VQGEEAGAESFDHVGDNPLGPRSGQVANLWCVPSIDGLVAWTR
jgi:hypothetical protein